MGALNEKIKELRIKKGFATAKDFAIFAGIPISSYSLYEKDTAPRSGALASIAKALGVSKEELLGLTFSTYAQSKYNYFKKLIEDNTEFCVIRFTATGKENAVAIIRKEDKEVRNTPDHLTGGKWRLYRDEEDFCNSIKKAIEEDIASRFPEIIAGEISNARRGMGGGFWFYFFDEDEEQEKEIST